MTSVVTALPGPPGAPVFAGETDLDAWWRATFDPEGTLAAPRTATPAHRFARRRQAVAAYMWFKVVRPAAGERARMLRALLDFLWRLFGRRITDSALGARLLELVARHLEYSAWSPTDPLDSSPLAIHGPPTPLMPAPQMVTVLTANREGIAPGF